MAPNRDINYYNCGEGKALSCEIGGTVRYSYQNVHHRENGPSKVFPNGTLWFCREGNLHREEGAALYQPSTGFSRYYLSNAVFTPEEFFAQVGLMRFKYPVAAGFVVIDWEGNTQYFRNDGYHRENGPSEIDSSGFIMFERKGWAHREEGPAAFSASEGCVDYYLQLNPDNPYGGNTPLSKEEFVEKLLLSKC